MAEASSNLARFDGVRYGRRAADIKNLEDLYVRSRTEGFGQEVKRRIMLGAYVLSSGYYDAYYRKAAQVRRLIRDEYLAALDKCDALWAPVSPVPAWNVGSLTADPLQMYLMQTPQGSGRRVPAARQNRLCATTTREGSTPLSPPEPLPQKARTS